MAKPGSSAARAIAGGRDLSLRKLGDDEARDMQERIEARMGARCNGCGRRITIGLRFSSIDPRDETGQLVQMSACSRDDCGFAERARVGATYMEPVEFAWLDENGPDAPAAAFIVARNERLAARAVEPEESAA